MREGRERKEGEEGRVGSRAGRPNVQMKNKNTIIQRKDNKTTTKNTKKVRTN